MFLTWFFLKRFTSLTKKWELWKVVHFIYQTPVYSPPISSSKSLLICKLETSPNKNPICRIFFLSSCELPNEMRMKSCFAMMKNWRRRRESASSGLCHDRSFEHRNINLESRNNRLLSTYGNYFSWLNSSLLLVLWFFAHSSNFNDSDYVHILFVSQSCNSTSPDIYDCFPISTINFHYVFKCR